MNFCLPKELTAKFLDSIKSGETNPETLSEMSSAERHAYFGKLLDPRVARDVNALFESKLLLKNQQTGMINWAKQLTGITEATRTDLISRIERMDRILNPKDQQSFLEDLASKRLGTDVSLEEAQKIAELSKNIQETKTAMENGGDRMAYGRAKVALGNYVSDLKNSNTLSIREKGIGGVLNEVAGTSKGLKASLDNSAIFRQGWKTLFSHPNLWVKNAAQSFADLANEFGGKKVMDEVQAEIQSRPTYPLMQKAKLDVGTTEEQFPSHLAERIPVLGKLYKASEAAYTGFVYRTRADVFDKYLDIARTAGIDITDKGQLLPIGKLVNSLTGRGYLGKGEQVAGVVNNVFFSPRFLKSNLDFLTAHQFQRDVTPFVRKQAAINLVKVVMGSASILAIANALMPGSVETDPRSSNFGKIRINGTTFDISGGMASILTLAAKLATQSSKSSTTGKVTALNSGKYGAQTGVDVLVSFAEGKLSPIASIVRDILKGQDYYGNQLTILGEASNLLTPLPITNAIQLYQSPKGAPVIMGILMDALGVSVNPPNPPKTKQSNTSTGSPLMNLFNDIFGAKTANAAGGNAFEAYSTTVNGQKLDISAPTVSYSEQHPYIPVSTDKIISAIAQNETGGLKTDPYSYHKPSGNKALGEDLGKYQVTSYLLNKYSPRYLGRTVTDQEFLANPKLQDEFMTNRVEALTKQGYTPAQIADLHRNGSTTEPGSSQYKRPDYVEKFLTNLGGNSQGVTNTNDMASTTVNAFPLTDKAKTIINNELKLSYNKNLPENVGGQTNLPYFHTLSPQDQGTTTPIDIAPGAQNPLSYTHEIFNAFFVRSNIDPKEFNTAWENAAKTNPQLKKTVDAELNSPETTAAYRSNGEDVTKNDYQLATERFALLGKYFGSDGLSGIPKELQKYYQPFLK